MNLRTSVLLCLVLFHGGNAYAQPNCTSVFRPIVTGGDGNLVNTRIWASPIGPNDTWGTIVYPITYLYPPNAVSVGLMTLTAETLKIRGERLRAAGFIDVDPEKWYVVGQTGVHEWVPDGIHFDWYHTKDTRSKATPPQSWVTLSKGDSIGLSQNLSVVLQKHEGVSLGVSVVTARYPEPIAVIVGLHIRECR